MMKQNTNEKKRTKEKRTKLLVSEMIFDEKVKCEMTFDEKVKCEVSFDEKVKYNMSFDDKVKNEMYLERNVFE